MWANDDPSMATSVHPNDPACTHQFRPDRPSYSIGVFGVVTRTAAVRTARVNVKRTPAHPARVHKQVLVVAVPAEQVRAAHQPLQETHHVSGNNQGRRRRGHLEAFAPILHTGDTLPGRLLAPSLVAWAPIAKLMLELSEEEGLQTSLHQPLSEPLRARGGVQDPSPRSDCTPAPGELHRLRRHGCRASKRYRCEAVR